MAFAPAFLGGCWHPPKKGVRKGHGYMAFAHALFCAAKQGVRKGHVHMAFAHALFCAAKQ
eukprot:NODE_4558_length_789_cov_2.604054_g3788_i0.p6 GENE.NODE_4558_length_789_cov_2.604054_g3788_i0~~NODE_4558_length_789_cov_2.604054_g3788_i0.p6  ORF type:complete len:60 (-),score=0.97 NODE_4558_length_789_cov_2.604054_g3788_i0:217-396(-)